MRKGYKTVNFTPALHATLVELANDAAEKEGLSKVSIPQLIERMVKVYKDKQD